MKRFTIFTCALFLLCGATGAFAQSDPVAVLKQPAASGDYTDAELFAKADALQSLTRTGTADAADAIAPFLHDDRLSTHARTALINLPGDVGKTVLRKELPKLKGGALLGTIQTLGTLKDTQAVEPLAKLAKSDDKSVVHAAIFALGKIGNDEAVAALEKIKEPAAEVRAAIQYASGDSAAKRGNAFAPDLLESNDSVVFRRALFTLARTKPGDPDAAGRELFAVVAKLPESKRIKVYHALAANKCRYGTDSAVATLADTTCSPKLRAAAIRYFGAVGKSAEAIVGIMAPLLASNDETLRCAAIDALAASELSGIDDAVARTIREGSDVAKTSAIAVAKKRAFNAVSFQAVKLATGAADSAVRQSAADCFALHCAASAEDAWFLMKRLDAKLSPEETTTLSDAVFLIGKRTPEPAKLSQTIADRFAGATPETKAFCFELLAQIGNTDSLAAIVQCANGGDDATLDKASQVLGGWINLDAAPYLMQIAKTCPVEKYRVRAVRGYLRLVRQMAQNATQQVEMTDAIAPLAVRPELKELVQQVYAQIEAKRTDKSIFDGKTFKGWEGDTKNIFRVENGCIVGGSFDRPVPRNEFLCTTVPYYDFTLTLECKILGEGANGGIQFRSKRVPNDREMIGYQADMTTDGLFWGSLYDESRRKTFLQKADPELVKKIYKSGEWNRYRIVCWGPRVKLYLNDVLTVDYVETEPIDREGVIGLQIHKGPPSESWYRNIRIEHYVQKTK